MVRETTSFKVDPGSNSLWQLYQTVGFWRVFQNTIVISLARITPWFKLKNFLYRQIRIEIGDKTAIAYKVMMDIMYPEKIHIGNNTIIGYNTTILAHEYLIDEYRLGDIYIGDNVMIGANVTILPGVTISDNAIIGAGAVIICDVPAGAFYAGNPARLVNWDKDTDKGEEGGL